MRLTLDRFEGSAAVLRTDDGQELVVPIDELPNGTEEGGVLDVRFGYDADTTETQTDRAKKILNEILGES